PGAPAPALDCTGPVELILTPTVVATTFTLKVQVSLGLKLSAIANPTVLPPGLADTIPEEVGQPPVTPVGFATTSPAGNVSENWTPVRTAVVLGLFTVKLRVDPPPTGIVLGEKLLVVTGCPNAVVASGNTKAIMRSGPINRPHGVTSLNT